MLIVVLLVFALCAVGALLAHDLPIERRPHDSDQPTARAVALSWVLALVFAPLALACRFYDWLREWIAKLKAVR